LQSWQSHAAGQQEKKMYEGMSDANKAASESIQKLLLTIPPASCSQFLAKIGSDEFLKTFASVSLGAAGSIQVKFEHDPLHSWGSMPTEVRKKLMQPSLQLSLKPRKRNTNASSASMLLQIALATPRFLFRLSHLASKSLQHLVWVIRPSQKLFFVRMIVGILHLHGRRLARRLFVPSSLNFRPARSVGISPVMMRAAMTWPLMLSPPKLLSKGLIGT
jgi:hypothetical protein